MDEPKNIVAIISCDTSHLQQALLLCREKLLTPMQPYLNDVTKQLSKMAEERESIFKEFKEFEESMQRMAELGAGPSMSEVFNELRESFCENYIPSIILPRPIKIIPIPVIKMNKKREHIYYHCRNNC
jgi:hypothetical protein